MAVGAFQLATNAIGSCAGWRISVGSRIKCLGHRADRNISYAAVSAKTAYITHGSPWVNGCIESFNARLRDELLDGEIFNSLKEARVVIESWRRHYNRASEHPSVYVIEGKRLCWPRSGPAAEGPATLS